VLEEKDLQNFRGGFLLKEIYETRDKVKSVRRRRILKDNLDDEREDQEINSIKIKEESKEFGLI
jgi:hypothetical protein